MITSISQQFNIDRDLLVAYSHGLVIGLLILSTLILFPGTTTTTTTNNHETTTTTIPADSQSTNTTESITRPKKNQPKRQQQSENNNNDDYGYWTPYRRLNFAVYVFLIAIIAAVWYAEYTDTSNDVRHPMTLIKMLLRTYFPREANVLLGEERRATGKVIENQGT